VLTLSIKIINKLGLHARGSIVIITTEGIDEKEALNSLSALINDFFGEGE